MDLSTHWCSTKWSNLWDSWELIGYRLISSKLCFSFLGVVNTGKMYYPSICISFLACWLLSLLSFRLLLDTPFSWFLGGCGPEKSLLGLGLWDKGALDVWIIRGVMSVELRFSWKFLLSFWRYCFLLYCFRFSSKDLTGKILLLWSPFITLLINYKD